ncbi:hypothetical protein ScPMuIL_000852 [Solemya velum]
MTTIVLNHEAKHQYLKHNDCDAAMSLRGLEGEELVQNLRHLVINFEPHIREAESVDQIEETLRNLEEIDENFHKYEFVKLLKKKIDDSLGPLIEDEIEKHASSGHVAGEETLVGKVIDRVIHSRQYGDLSRKLKKNVTDGVEELLINFDAEFGTGNHTHHSHHRHHDRQFLGSDEDESSYDSSSNQDTLMFMNQEFLHKVADMISKTKDAMTQEEGMRKLNQIPSVDILTCDHWHMIRRHVLEILADQDETLSNLSQKFLTKAFTTTSPHTREMYTLLAEYLIGQFHSNRANIPKVRTGLDVTRPDMARLIRAFRLMNDFQHETINYWIRYPDRFLKEIVESTLNLLSIHQVGPPGTISHLTPIHFIALLDPKAQWFIKWMHGNYSRSVLLNLLEKYKPIVENAVQHCLEYSAARKMPFDVMSDTSEVFSRVNLGSDGKRRHYTNAELEYVYFLHSVCMIGRMLCFVDGRNFFPLKLKNSEEPVTVTKLLVSLVLVVVDPSIVFTAIRSVINEYEPAILVTEVLKGLCISENVCQTCFFNDEITNTLLSPVAQFLDPSDQQARAERTLLHVADILSMIASSTKGRRHLLYGGDKHLFNRTKASAGHLIADFTKRALLNKLPKEVGMVPSRTVIGAFLYVCRQLYNTCEGLLVLYPYDLHTVISQSLKQACLEAEEVITPTPSDDRDDDSTTSSDSSSNVTTKMGACDIRVWEETLKDNLLNFASTAKGVLLLQQTGAMNDCLTYMYTRYEKKLQVSKCEKFGYGCMVTQVAATAPGIFALSNTGYLKSLIAELWAVVECIPSDAPLFTPTNWPVDSVDRSWRKHLARLLNVLTSFPAIYELLAGRQLPVRDDYTFREVPETIIDLMDRIVIVDRPTKLHFLFNSEHAQTFGLRLLSAMVSCLDTYLLLQSQYKFQDVLRAAQAENHTESSKPILYMHAVYPYFMAVKRLGKGGKKINILAGKNSDVPYPFPMVSTYPVPRKYMPNLGGRSAAKQDNELMKFLNSKKQDKGRVWLNKCRIAFTKVLTAKPEQLKGNLIQNLLEHSVVIMSQIQDEVIFPYQDYSGDPSQKKSSLSPLKQLGVRVAIRYGIHLKLVHTSGDAMERLTQSLRQTSNFLQQQQRPVRSPLQCLQGGYPGFDWFGATIFLLFNGNTDKTWNFLHRFSTLAVSGYAWLPRLHNSVHLPEGMMLSGIHPLFSCTGHNIEFILQTELPLVASAFKMSGYTPAQLCFHWLKQCFWNYLDWLDICHYICVCIIMGLDYQVYLCASILKFLQRDIAQHMQTQNLIIFLKEGPIQGFHVAEHLKYMQELETKYRKIVLPDMLNISKP